VIGSCLPGVLPTFGSEKSLGAVFVSTATTVMSPTNFIAIYAGNIKFPLTLLSVVPLSPRRATLFNLVGESSTNLAQIVLLSRFEGAIRLRGMCD